MWTYEHTETTRATPAQLWARYAEPATWPEWDAETAWVTVEGPVAVGSRGTLKPVHGPATRFTFTEVSPEVGFADVTRLPLARLAFTHRIEPLGTGSRFTHGVTISGPLAPLFARVVGKGIAAGLPSAMRALAQLAEGGPAESGAPCTGRPR